MFGLASRAGLGSVLRAAPARRQLHAAQLCSRTCDATTGLRKVVPGSSITRATRWYTEGAKQAVKEAKRSKALKRSQGARERQIQISEMPFSQLTPAQKVVEGTKTTGSVLVIGLGVGLFGVLVYNLADEIFGSDPHENLMKEALNVVTSHPDVKDRLGAPIIADEGTLKGADYKVGEADFTRMRFSVLSDEGTGIVQLEQRRQGGSTNFRYLLVDCKANDGYRPDKRIVLVDNRAEDA